MSPNLEEYLCEDIVIIMRGLFENGKVLKDYKCVGNMEGTTIVLRLHDPKHVSTPHFTLGKSPARQSRDQERFDQYRFNMSSAIGQPQYSPWTTSACVTKSDQEAQTVCDVDNPLSANSDPLSHNHSKHESPSFDVDAQEFIPLSHPKLLMGRHVVLKRNILMWMMIKI